MVLSIYILICGIISLVIIYIWFMYCYNYWNNRNFPYLKPSFPLGNNQTMLCKFPGPHLESSDYYTKIKKKGYKFAGVFSITRPILVVVDPDISKDILIKDFKYFSDRGFYKHPSDYLSMNLFGLDSEEWRINRTELTPTFTSGKIRMMIPKIISVSDSLIQNIEKYTDIKADINIKQIASEFTVNSIASCILGIIPGTPEKLGNCFAEVTRKHFERERLSYLLRVSFLNRFPDLSCKLGLRYIKKEVAEFFLKLVEDCISYRKENKFICSDFLQSLINLRNKKNAKVNILTDEFLAAQVFSLFSASLETSSTVITFTLYELATNTHIQERLRKEINEVLEKHKGQLNDVTLNEMIYLRQVINESLRLYPPITSLERRCMKNYKIDGTDLMIEKHISITIPIFGLHRDSRNYPNPEKFDPDRFSAENKHNIQPYTYLPFGMGPRSCIGQRIGFLLIQIALVEILKKFRLIVSASTRLPFEMDKVNLFLTIKNPIFLKAEKIQH